MRPNAGDQVLERALIDLGAHVAYPPEPALAAAVGQRLASGRRGRVIRLVRRGRVRLPGLRRGPGTAAALAVLILAAAVLAVFPGARTAAAGLLRLPGIRIIFGPPAPAPSPRPSGPAPTALGLETPTTLEAARAAVPFRVMVPALGGLPRPRVSLGNMSRGQAVLLAFPPRSPASGVPPTPGSAQGLIVTEFQGRLEPAYMTKFIGPGTRLTDVSVNGTPGFWIEGEAHELVYVRPDGQVDTLTSRLAGNTLAWDQGGVTIRIEGAASLADALAVAASMH